MSERRIRNNKRKRNKQLRRNRLYLILSLVVTITISVALFGFSAKASDCEEQIAYKYYTSIIIEEGDSLWSIANENYTEQFKSKKAYMKEIKEINGLSDEHLISGQYLIIPYYSYEFIG